MDSSGGRRILHDWWMLFVGKSSRHFLRSSLFLCKNRWFRYEVPIHLILFHWWTAYHCSDDSVLFYWIPQRKNKNLFCSEKRDCKIIIKSCLSLQILVIHNFQCNSFHLVTKLKRRVIKQVVCKSMQHVMIILTCSTSVLWLKSLKDSTHSPVLHYIYTKGKNIHLVVAFLVHLHHHFAAGARNHSESKVCLDWHKDCKFFT